MRDDTAAIVLLWHRDLAPDGDSREVNEVPATQCTLDRCASISFRPPMRISLSLSMRQMCRKLTHNCQKISVSFWATTRDARMKGMNDRSALPRLRLGCQLGGGVQLIRQDFHVTEAGALKFMRRVERERCTGVAVPKCPLLLARRAVRKPMGIPSDTLRDRFWRNFRPAAKVS